jgi:hypothetical protein
MPITVIENPSGEYSFTSSQATTVSSSAYDPLASGSVLPGTSSNFIFLSGSSLSASIVSGSYLYAILPINSVISGVLAPHSTFNGMVTNSDKLSFFTYTFPYDTGNNPWDVSISGLLGHGLIYTASPTFTIAGYIYSPTFFISASFIQTSSVSASFADTASLSGSYYTSSASSSFIGPNTTEIHASSASNLRYVDAKNNPYLTTLDIRNCPNLFGMSLSSCNALTNITFSGNTNFNYLDIQNIKSGSVLAPLLSSLVAQAVQSGSIYASTEMWEPTMTSSATIAGYWNTLSGSYGWKVFNYAYSTINGTVKNWESRIISTAGFMPSQTTLQALNNFYNELTSKGIASKMKAINCFVPDDLTSCRTPLITTVSGSTPWANTNFVNSDLSVNGLKGSTSGVKYLNTGILPTQAFTDTSSFGLSVYNTFPDSTFFITDIGCANGTGRTEPRIELDTCTLNDDSLGIPTGSYFYCGDSNAYIYTTATPLSGGLGFTSGNRINLELGGGYWISASISNESLTVPFTKAPGSPYVLNSGGLPTRPIKVFYSDRWSVSSPKQLSFAAIHDGLTPSEVQILSNAVKVLRLQLGGGYV